MLYIKPTFIRRSNLTAGVRLYTDDHETCGSLGDAHSTSAWSLSPRLSIGLSRQEQERACGVRQLLPQGAPEVLLRAIGDFRCRATEKILAGMTRPCKFVKNGCPEIDPFTEIRVQ